MPVMDGFETTAAIRSGRTAVQNPRIPIIAMTAHAMKGDRERCLAAGMDDYIPKPLAPQAVAAALEKWLDHVQKKQVSVPTVLSGTPIFDRQAFLERLMGDLDLAKEIGAGFLEDMPRQLDKLKECIAAGDAKTAGGQAHAIKGAAANVGGLAFSAVAQTMEQAARAGRLVDVIALLPELERQFGLLQEKLRERENEDSAG
jgi:HPt (histidine-containing phosphotransfer) domain-containing protein